MLEIIVASLAVMAASLAGVFFTSRTLSGWMHKNLSLLVSFSAGIFLVVSLSLLFEAFESLSVPVALGFFGLGFIVIGGIFSLLPHAHHHHADHCDHAKIDPRRILASDAIHNIGDGILIAVSFAASPALGVASTISILIHEIIQEVSEFFVLKESGYSSKKALSLNFAISGTILIGSILAFFFISEITAIQTPLLAFSGGAFLYTVLKDLLPHSIKESKDKDELLNHVIWFVMGITIFLVLSHSFGHSHNDSHDHIDDAHMELGH